MRNLYIVFLAAVVATGCATAGNEKVRTETKDTIASKLTKGKSTKADVKGQFGEPGSVSLTDGGNEVWKYEYAHATPHAVNFVSIVGLFAGGADVDKNEVVFIFDKDNVMQNYTVHQSQSQVQRNGGNVGSN